METLKKTPVFQEHESAGAKMVPFAGYSMPVQYSSIVDEHNHVRKHAGLFDVSHMARIHLKGPEALGFTQNLTCNEVRKLKDGGVQYSVMCNERGGCIDDLTVYRFSSEHLMVINNASRHDTITAWLKQHQTSGVQIEDQTAETALFAFQGPEAISLLSKELDENLAESMKFFSFKESVLNGIPIFLSRTGYTGEGGFEIACQADHGPELWQFLLSLGNGAVKPIGLGARDTLRLEMGYMLYGNDIDEETTPLEAGLGWVVKLETSEDFVGKQALIEQKEKGFTKRLVGFKTSGKTAIPRPGYELKHEGRVIGSVTSGSISPVLEVGIGLGYVETAFAKNESVTVQIRKREETASIVRPPFVKTS